MRVFAALKLSFLTGIFFGVLGMGVTFVAPTPAQARCWCIPANITCDCVGQKFRDAVDNNMDKVLENRLKEAIGATDGSANFPKKIPGQSGTFSGSRASLIDYFETVWWERLVAIEQARLGNEHEFATALNADALRVEEAKQMNDHVQNVRTLRAQNGANFIDADAVLCPGISMSQSDVAARQYVRVLTGLESGRNAARSSGSAQYPDYSKGILGHARAKIAAQIASGVTDPTGNDGANTVFGTGRPELINAHIDPDTLFGTHVLSEDPTKKHSVALADTFVQNLFGRRMVFSALQKLTNPPSAVHSEIMDQRNNVRAAVNMFQKPFDEAKARRQPLDLQATQWNVAALERAGITASGGAAEALSAYVTENQKMSFDSLHATRYEVYTFDPQTVVQNASWDEPNVMRFMATTMLNQTGLLYDILKEMRLNNALLGTAGGLAAVAEHQVVEAKARALNAN